jgi:hypothetical protein
MVFRPTGNGEKMRLLVLRADRVGFLAKFMVFTVGFSMIPLQCIGLSGLPLDELHLSCRVFDQWCD